MLTFGCAKTCRGPLRAACAGAAFALSVVAWAGAPSQARAQTVVVGGCVGGSGSLNCVARWGPAGDPYIRTVPQPADAAERARADARERRWVDRCRPVITQDYYGVARYHYAAPGCDFDLLGH